MDLSWNRIWALSLRYFYTYTSDFWKLINSFYWASIEILIWVNVGNWLQSSSSNYVTEYFLISAIAWMPFTRAAYDISLATLREINTSNLCNLFSAPLKLIEWIISLIIFAFFVSLIIVLFGFSFSYIFYSSSLFSLYLLPILFIVFLSGISLGLFGSSIIIYFGNKVEELIYMLPWSLAPFSGVYYDLVTLPYWMQLIGSLFPMSYIFTYIHAVIENRPANFNLVWIGLILAIFYLILSVLLFNFMFDKSKDLGLSRLNS